jgi:ketosteroid isomerase-like protein
MPEGRWQDIPQDELEALARDTYDAWARGDLGPLMERAHPDIVWHTWMPGLDEPVAYHGYAGVRDFTRDWQEAWDQLAVEVEEVRRLYEPDRLLILLRWVARGEASQAEVSQRAGHVLHFDDEFRLVRMDGYMTAEDALEAASAGSSIGPGISSSGGGISSPITRMRRFSAL